MNVMQPTSLVHQAGSRAAGFLTSELAAAPGASAASDWRARWTARHLARRLVAAAVLSAGLLLALGVASSASAAPATSAADGQAPSAAGSFPVEEPLQGHPPAPAQPTADPARGSSDARRSSDSVRTLSVEPGRQPLLPDDRPAWVGAPADFSSDFHRLYVGSIPTLEPEDADAALDDPLVAAVRQYVQQQVIEKSPETLISGERRHSNDQLFPEVRRFEAEALECALGQLTPFYIRRNLINDPTGYLAELSTSEGPMYQKWVAVEITPIQRQQMLNWYREAVQRQRLASVGLGLLSVVGLVGLGHFLLRRRHRARMPALELPSSPATVAVEGRQPNRKTARFGAFRFGGLAILGCVLLFPATIAVAGLMYFSRAQPRELAPLHRSHINSGWSAEFEESGPQRPTRVPPPPPVAPVPQAALPADVRAQPERSPRTISGRGKQLIIIHTGNQ